MIRLPYMRFELKGIEALYYIFQEQSFEEAAKKLFITQSAVSQRLKSIQKLYSDSLIIKSDQYCLTSKGKILIRYFKQIINLEQGLEADLFHKKKLQSISFAISRDSLESWFMRFLINDCLLNQFNIEIIADNEDLTLNYLRDGLVSSSFSSKLMNLNNCERIFLGNLKYFLVASPRFMEKFKIKDIKDLSDCFSIKFDKNDRLTDLYFENYHNTAAHENYHTIPSIEGFKQAVLSGNCFALIPEIQIREELKDGSLIKIEPQITMDIPIYFYFWKYLDSFEKQYYENLIEKIKNILC